jgi:hypothetical protein
MCQIGTHDNVDRHPRPEEEWPGNETTPYTKEATQDPNQETNAYQEKWINGYASNWKFHDLSWLPAVRKDDERFLFPATRGVPGPTPGADTT